MKIYPAKSEKQKKINFDHLTALEKKTRLAAILLAFGSVFVFFVKILFF